MTSRSATKRWSGYPVLIAGRLTKSVLVLSGLEALKARLLRLIFLFLFSLMGCEPLRFLTLAQLLWCKVTERMASFLCVEMKMIGVGAVCFWAKCRAKDLTGALMNRVKKSAALIGGMPSVKYADMAAVGSDELAYINSVGDRVLTNLL